MGKADACKTGKDVAAHVTPTHRRRSRAFNSFCGSHAVYCSTTTATCQSPTHAATTTNTHLAVLQHGQRRVDGEQIRVLNGWVAFSGAGTRPRGGCGSHTAPHIVQIALCRLDRIAASVVRQGVRQELCRRTAKRRTA